MPDVRRAVSAWPSEARARVSGTGCSRLALPYRVISKAAEFERVLRVSARWRTEHFALHHCTPAGPCEQSRRTKAEPCAPFVAAGTAELSTGQVPNLTRSVDDLDSESPWLGLVVPKRFAKRAVTRTLLKRRMRMAFVTAAELRAGWWVCRLRAPFPAGTFPSATSRALDEAVRAELHELLEAAQRPSRR
jgi:ribonuclease P protein component